MSEPSLSSRTRGRRALRPRRPSQETNLDVPPLLESESEAEAPVSYQSDSEEESPRSTSRRARVSPTGPGWKRSQSSSPAESDSEAEWESFMAKGGGRDQLIAELLTATRNAKSNSAGSVPFDRSSPGREKRRFDKSETGWASVRSKLQNLSRKSMSVAEAGARLYELLRVCPGLLTGAVRIPDTASGDDGESTHFQEGELLPLPVPHIAVKSPEELNRFFPNTGEPSKEAVVYATDAWLVLVIEALNTMGASGKPPLKAKGKPSASQARAID